MIYKKICSVCGRQFETTDSRRKTCSKTCFKENAHKKGEERWQRSRDNALSIAPLPIKTCPNCGKKFQPEASRSQIYCCLRCRNETAYKKRKKKKMKFARCTYCGAVYISRTPRQHYCSDRCKNSAVEELKGKKPKDPEAIKKRRKTTQAHIDEVAAAAKEAGMSYGQYQATKSNIESVLDNTWAKELLRRQENEKRN